MTDFQVGDRVVAIQRLEAVQEREFGNRYFAVPENVAGRVTSIRSPYRVRVRWEGHPYVGTVDVADIQLENSEEAQRMRAEREAREAEERKQFEPGEGDIQPDDPRLAWLWRKAAKYATEQGYCPTYDAICDTLGIPGREREFTVNFRVDGLELRAQNVMSTSHDKAIAKVLEKVKLSSEAKVEVFDRNTNRWNPYAALM